jgi:hypothetical protein
MMNLRYLGEYDIAIIRQIRCKYSKNYMGPISHDSNSVGSAYHHGGTILVPS